MGLNDEMVDLSNDIRKGTSNQVRVVRLLLEIVRDIKEIKYKMK